MQPIGRNPVSASPFLGRYQEGQHGQSIDGDPYRSRASLEREMAGRSSDPSVRRIHENMARMYDALSQSYGPDIPTDLASKPGGSPSGTEQYGGGRVKH
jgi:hypothetical protein